MYLCVRINSDQLNLRVSLLEYSERFVGKRLADEVDAFEIEDDVPESFHPVQDAFGLGA